MAKFLSRIFSSRSSSPKRGSFRGSQSSVNEGGSRRSGASSNMRAATSLDNLASYYINPKDLDKHKLHKASWEGNLNKVARHSKPDQLNMKDQYSRTPLHLAVARGHIGIVKHLVHEGAKMDAVDHEQRTPLLKAVLGANQHPEVTYQICHYLLSEGADSFINAVDIHGKNALHYAIDFDNEQLVTLFLCVPACDPNFRDREEMTPLHIAVKRNNAPIVYHLLSDQYHHQADPNLMNRHGQTPLHMAAQLDEVNIVRIILQAELEEPCDPTIVDAQQLTAYQIAQANHHDTCAKIIAEYQEGWERLTPRRDTTGSINEQEINPIVANRPQRFNNPDDDDDDDSSDNSSSVASSSRRTNQYQNQTGPSSSSANKPDSRALDNLVKNNPLHTDARATAAPATNNQGISSLFRSNPLQPSEPTNKSVTGAQQRQPTSLFNASPGPTQRKEAEIPSTGMSIGKAITGANLIVGQTTSPAQGNTTVSAIVGATPQPTASNPSVWSPYSPYNSKPEQPVTAAKRIESWSQSTTSQSEDDDSESSRIRTPPAGFAQPSTLNGTAMFTTTTPPKALPSDSESEEDSIEAAVQQHNMQKAAGGIQNLVDRQIGNSYLFPSPKTSSNALSDVVYKQTGHIHDSPPTTFTSDVVQNLVNKQIGSNYGPAPVLSGPNVVQSPVNRQVGSSFGSTPAASTSAGIQNLVNKQIGSNFQSTPATSAPNAIQSPANRQVGSSFGSTPVAPASNGVQNLVNKQIGGSFGSPPAAPAPGGVQSLINKLNANSHGSPSTTSFPRAQSPSSEHSSWTSSSVGVNKDPPTKGISSLVQQQPLLSGKKSNEPTWDDSRPLSADLKRSSVLTDSSDESDFDDDHKSATIVKSPYTTPTLSNLVQQNIQPTESKTTGVENLTKIIDSIMHAKPVPPKLSTPPNTIGKLVAPPLIQRTESSSSNASSIIDDTMRPMVSATIAANSMQQHLYINKDDPASWSELTTSGHDFQLIGRNYSNEMVQHGQRQTPRSSIHHEFNNLRSSMSSSTSSIQNNMDRLSELKEDIKEIERKQENSLELKRQLKDMEIKKNNFEALYKKNDQLLREIESKLEKETSEKQRLEWTTKNLNMELKSVRQKLQSLEDEKDILNQRCVKLKEERDNYDEKLRIHQTTSLQTAAAGVLREEDIDKIKARHREEMKLLSAENDDLHQRTRQLQSDLQLHRESLDVTIRYKIDLEKALEEKTFLQHELDRLKHEKDLIEQDKIDYKTKSDNLQEEIRILLLDRSKIEQKLNGELQEQIKQRQRTSDDVKKYKTQIEQLNIKLGDAEARLLVLQTQNEALIASKDREIKNEFETLTQRLNLIESEKHSAEQRYHNEYKEIAHKQQQQHVLHEPLVIVTSGNGVQHQHSPSSPCVQCDTLRRSFEQEREHRLQTEKDNERLRDAVSRQHKQQDHEQVLNGNSKQIRSDVERANQGIDRIRDDLGKFLSTYDPPNNFQQQAQLHSQIESLRRFYEDEFHKQQQQLLNAKTTNGSKSPIVVVNGYQRRSSPRKHDEYDHSPNGSLNCSICSNSRLLRERLDNAIDTSLADQRIQTIRQIPILPRQTSPLLTTNNTTMSSVELLRKRYYI